MGLFGKLKQNMNGGVKVQVRAPSSVPGNQVIPVTVTITSDSSQTINKIKAEIKAEAKEQGLSLGRGGAGGMGVQDSRSMNQTIAQVENRDPFTIGPGETKTVNLELFISGSAGSANPMGQMPQLGGVGGALMALASAAQNLEHINYIYSVHASADVQGVTMDPSDKQAIQILPAAAATPIGAPGQTVANFQGQAPPPPPAPAMPPIPPIIPGMPAPTQPAQPTVAPTQPPSPPPPPPVS